MGLAPFVSSGSGTGCEHAESTRTNYDTNRLQFFQPCAVISVVQVDQRLVPGAFSCGASVRASPELVVYGVDEPQSSFSPPPCSCHTNRRLLKARLAAPLVSTRLDPVVIEYYERNTTHTGVLRSHLLHARSSVRWKLPGTQHPPQS